MKKIAIVGWKTGENSFGTTLPYIEFLSYFGEVIILTPNCEVRKDLDLLVLPGGKDVNPNRYGEMPNLRNTDPNQILEYFDEFKLPQYIEQGTPVFGICRGFQTLNVHFGGSLEQHYVHDQSTKSRHELVHKLEIELANIPQELKSSLIGLKGSFKSNSLHHQVVTPARLGDDLLPTLFETSDKELTVIEGFIHSDLKVAGVQYHPEEIWDTYAMSMINYLLK